MVVRYRLTESDFRQAQMLALRERSVVRILALFAAIVLLVTVVTLVTSASATRALWNLVWTIAFAIILVTLLWWVLRRARTTMYRGNPELDAELTAEVLPDQITFTSPVSTGTSRWAAFSHVVESQELIVLWRRNRVMNVIPKRAFQPGELVQFREILAAHLPDKRPRRRS